MKSLSSLFSKNLRWKFFSLIVAFLLWFTVINLEDPMDTRQIPLSISFVNTERLDQQNLLLTNEDIIKSTTVRITVRGKRKSLEELATRVKEISATINLGVLNGSTVNISEPVPLPVDITLPSSLSDIVVTERTPFLVHVSLDKITTVVKNVDIAVEGFPAEGYEALSRSAIQITPMVINMTGASSILNKIASVKVVANLDGASDDISIDLKPRLYDANGQEVLGVEKNIETVNVYIPIYKREKLRFNFEWPTGVPADGYTVADVITSLEFAEVLGPDSSIAKLDSITLPSIDVTGSTGDVSKTYNINTLLPSGVQIKNGTDNDITLTVVIKPLVQKDIYIPLQNLNIVGELPDGLQYHIVSDEIQLSIIGISDLVNRVVPELLTGTADISGIEVGNHDVPVSIQLPVGITPVADAHINIEVEDIAEEINVDGDDPNEDESIDDTEPISD